MMLRDRVSCDKCKGVVERMSTLEGDNEKLYCFKCYKTLKQKVVHSPKIKFDIKCNKCNYSCSTSKKECPYCGEKSNLTLLS